MTLPGISITRSNVGVSPVPQTPNTALVIGPCSQGTVNQVQTFGNPATLQSTLGFGPAPTLAEIMLADGASSVLVIPSNASIAGSTTALVTSSVPNITLSGTPNDAFDIRGSISAGGPIGTATFQYSLDGNQTLSVPLTVSGTYILPNTGLSLSFSVGTYVAGNTFSATAYAPRMNSNDLLGALNSYTGSMATFGTPYIVAVANHTTASKEGFALSQAMDQGLTTYLSFQMPTVGIVPTGGIDGSTADTTSVFSAFASSAQNGVMVVAERARRQVPLGFQGYGNPLLPFAFPVADRVQADLVSTNPAWVGNGALTAVSSPTYDEFVQGQVYGLVNIGAPMTYLNLPGVFLEQGSLKTQPGSSFQYVQWVKVMNLAQVVLQGALRKYINSFVRTGAGGTINKADAAKIEGDVNALLQAAIMQPNNAENFQGHASAVQFHVDQSYNVLQNSAVQGTLVIVPLANVSQLKVTISFAVSLAL